MPGGGMGTIDIERNKAGSEGYFRNHKPAAPCQDLTVRMNDPDELAATARSLPIDAALLHPEQKSGCR